jgi:hypothetical protein
MKKIILVITVFALISPMVFGQIAFGGKIDLWGNLAEDYLMDDKSDEAEARANGDWEFGFWAGASNDNVGGKGYIHSDLAHIWAYIWWKPVEYFFLKMGAIGEDTTWAGPDLTDKGLHGNDWHSRERTFVGGSGNYAYEKNGYAGNFLPTATGFYQPSYGKWAVQVSGYLGGLALNLGFNFANPTAGTEAKAAYVDGLNLQLVYAIDGVGEAAVSFVNAPEEQPKNVYAQWKMPIADTMKLEFGANLGFLDENLEPLKFGLGFGLGDYATSTMVLNTRVGLSVPMDDKSGDPLVGFDLVWSYNFDIFRLYVPAGMSLALGDETILAWSFTPYIGRRLGAGGPEAYMGVTVYNGSGRDSGPQPGSALRPEKTVFSLVKDGDDKNRINWAIPIGMLWEL